MSYFPLEQKRVTQSKTHSNWGIDSNLYQLRSGLLSSKAKSVLDLKTSSLLNPVFFPSSCFSIKEKGFVTPSVLNFHENFIYVEAVPNNM